jgi:tetratricopeptide (TPR) repeat protein
MAFKGANKDVRTIAKALGVRYILEGAVRRAGNRLRISAQLIEARADEHVWADIYDGSIEDVFAMQERLARVIVSALELRLTDDEDRRLAERPIPDVRAYECYLRARHEAWRWRQDAIDRAVQLLRNGLEIVGDNAGLYAALGFAYLQYREAGIDFTDHPLHQADACAARAFALDPSSAPALRLRAWIHYSRAEVQEAVHALKAAREIDPNNADTLLLLANCYLISGRTSSARPLIQRLLAIDPLTPVTRCLPGYADVLEGRFAVAVEPYRQMFEMDPDNPMARLFYVFILSLNGRTAAIHDVVQQFAADVVDTIPARVALFVARAHDKDEQGARAVLTPELEPAATAADVFPRLLAYGFALLGDSDRALQWLEVAVQRGFINYPFLGNHDPSLARFRKHPRWSKLLGTVRQRWEQFDD